MNFDFSSVYLYKVMNECWRDVFFIPPRDVLYNYFSFVHFGVTQQPSRTFRNKPPITEVRNYHSKLRTKGDGAARLEWAGTPATYELCPDSGTIKLVKINYLNNTIKGKELTYAKSCHELKM